jgi:hypothetical protein
MRSTLFSLTLLSALLLLPCVLCAQTGSDTAGGSGSTSGSTGGSSGGSSSTSTEFGTTIETPEFQGFDTSSQTFIGIPDSTTFVGVDDAFAGQSRATSARRNTTTTRTTTSRRTTASRGTTRSAMGSSYGANNASVRAATTTDFEISPFNLEDRQIAFQTRLTRLPQLNLSDIPKQVDIKFGNSTDGTVAVLNGTVSTEREKRVMKQLLLLEPGVDRVENKLVVKEK